MNKEQRDEFRARVSVGLKRVRDTAALPTYATWGSALMMRWSRRSNREEQRG